MFIKDGMFPSLSYVDRSWRFSAYSGPMHRSCMGRPGLKLNPVAIVRAYCVFFVRHGPLYS